GKAVDGKQQLYFGLSVLRCVIDFNAGPGHSNAIQSLIFCQKVFGFLLQAHGRWRRSVGDADRLDASVGSSPSGRIYSALSSSAHGSIYSALCSPTARRIEPAVCSSAKRDLLISGS